MNSHLIRINVPRGLQAANVSGGGSLVVRGDSPFKLMGKAIKPQGKAVIYCTLYYYTGEGFTGATVAAAPVPASGGGGRYTKEWTATFARGDLPRILNVPNTVSDQTRVEAELWIEQRGHQPP